MNFSSSFEIISNFECFIYFCNYIYENEKWKIKIKIKMRRKENWVPEFWSRQEEERAFNNLTRNETSR